MNSPRDIGRWFRLQVEHVRRAIRTPVPAKEVFRHKEVQEQTLAENPNVTLRRTITDEMIVNKEGFKTGTTENTEHTEKKN